MEGTLTKIAEKLEALSFEVSESRREITTNLSTLTSVVRALECQMKEVQELKSRYLSLEEKLERKDRHIQFLNTRLRMNNLVMYNVFLTQTFQNTNLDLPHSIIHICRNVDIDLREEHINVCFELGKNPNNPPVLLSLVSNWKKGEIFRKRRELRNLGISLSHDRSKEEREAYKKVLPVLNELREKGHNPIFRNGEIYLNGVKIDR